MTLVPGVIYISMDFLLKKVFLTTDRIFILSKLSAIVRKPVPSFEQTGPLLKDA